MRMIVDKSIQFARATHIWKVPPEDRESQRRELIAYAVWGESAQHQIVAGSIV